MTVKMRGSRGTIFVALMAAALCSSLFHAKVGAAGADDLIARSIELRRANHDHEALPLLIEAVAKQPSPRAYAHLGTCEQALGIWVSAETHLGQALSHASDPWIQKNEAELRKALDFIQTKIGSVEIWGKPDGARIKIDGEEVGTLPMGAATHVAVGTRTLSVEHPGFFSETRPIEIRAGKFANREHVELRPLAAHEETASVPAPPPSITVEAARPSSESPEEAAAPPPIYRKWWFWTAVGVVAVGAGASIVFLTRSTPACTARMGGTCTTF